MLDGIKVYFDFTLADHLLYRPEKEEHKVLGIVNPVFSKKTASHSHLCDDSLNAESANEHPVCGRLPSQVYGPVHLLRLFVKLPYFLSCTQLPPSHVQLLHACFRDLLNYLCLRKHELFLEEHYHDTTSSVATTSTNCTEDTDCGHTQTHK